MSEIKGRIVQHTRLEALIEELGQWAYGLTLRLDSRTRFKNYGGVTDCRVLIILTACYETDEMKNPDTIYLWVAEAGYYQQINNKQWGEYSREFVFDTVKMNMEKLKEIIGERIGISEVKQGMYYVPSELLDVRGITTSLDLYASYRKEREREHGNSK